MQSGDQYGVTDMLMQILVMPRTELVRLLEDSRYRVRSSTTFAIGPGAALVASGLGFLSVTGIWALVTHFAGVSL